MLLRLENSYQSMTSHVRQVERIANNLANASTIGFRKDRSFVEVLTEGSDAEGAPNSTRRLSHWADHAQGSLQQTDAPLDVAINGEGFFVLSDPATGQTRYTRAGHFLPDEEGTLRAPNGLIVEGTSGPIEIPQDADVIEIRRDGTVLVDDNEVGALRIVRFDDPSTLRRIDAASFEPDGVEPADVEEPIVVQGQLEQSNVDAVREMSELIAYSRLFEAQQKTLSTVDGTLEHATRELSRF
jgi:flagellar basal-body rod protein FlgF/flagellar basal-body rod protein FlgG